MQVLALARLVFKHVLEPGFKRCLEPKCCLGHAPSNIRAQHPPTMHHCSRAAQLEALEMNKVALCGMSCGAVQLRDTGASGTRRMQVADLGASAGVQEQLLEVSITSACLPPTPTSTLK